MILNKTLKRIFILVIDFCILSFSLYLSLALRNFDLFNHERFLKIYYPFLIIIFINLIIFFMYGLYDKMTTKIYKELNSRILTSLILSGILGSIIYYSTDYFNIAPKILLFIYLILSFLLIFFWRKSVRYFLKSSEKLNILLVAEGQEILELKNEIENNKILNIKKIEILNLENLKADENIFEKINQIINLDENQIQKNIFENVLDIKNLKNPKEKFNIIAINLHHPLLKNNLHAFYNLYLQNIEIINFANLYEEILQKVPLENIDSGWIFDNLYNKKNLLYEKLKRVLDIILAFPVFLISLIFYPFVYLILKIQDNGSLFYTAERIGKNNKIFKFYKFRSMTPLKISEIDITNKQEKNRLTKFGKFMRKTRIDELPQLINILKGDLSFIGPRCEFPALVERYEKEISYYNLRHTITPGLSGYAQIYQERHTIPKYGEDVEGTRIKLSHDIYYIKHRSFLMDVSLIIKTIKNLLSKEGE